MPFTASHVAAILPFVRTPLAPAALAIGAMTPDIPYFLPLNVDRDLTHSLAGAPTIDLAIALIAFAAWLLLLRGPTLDYSPGWLRERMALEAQWRVGGPVLSWLVVVVALELGILTHLLLDLFTHEGGWLETVAPFTSEKVGMFTIVNLIHGTVSIVTGLIVVLWVRRWMARTPREQRASRVGVTERRASWVGLTAVLVAVGLVAWGRGIAAGEHPLDSDLMGASFFIAVGVAGAVALVLALVWWLRRVR